MNRILLPVLRSLFAGALLAGLTGLAQPAAAPAKPAKKPTPAVLLPIEDQAGLPRVLIIGDSISMGYTMPVRKLLDGKANVHRIPMNGGPTSTGTKNLAKWLGEGKWDVITFNWGLHDLRRDAADKHQIVIEDYEKNLTDLVAQLKATGATLLWVSTTPVPEGDLKPPRSNDDVIKYNKVAAKIMAANEVQIVDLYAFALPQLKDLQIPVNVHFTPKGSDALAGQVVAAIEQALPKK